MRTTLDLPDDLLKRAKIEAVQRGTSLRDIVASALEREFSRPSDPTKKQKRTKFPIFASAAPGSLRLSGAGIAKMENDEDARRHGRSG